MALSFPNQSRSYDATRRAVRFWGHDSAMEASFFVAEDALKRVQPDMRFDEAGLLGACTEATQMKQFFDQLLQLRDVPSSRERNPDLAVAHREIASIEGGT